jgi:hypothetical protein
MDYAPFTLISSTKPVCFLFSQKKIGAKRSAQEAQGGVIGLYFISFGNGRINLEANLN